MTLRTAGLSIVIGLLAAAGLFAWSEAQVGRSPLERLAAASATPSPRPAMLGPTTTSAAATPRPAAPTPTPPPAPTPTRPPAPAPTGPQPTAPEAARPTAVSGPVGPGRPTPAVAPPAPSVREVGISFGELDRELKQAIEGGGTPLRNPRLRFLPPDRVGLQGAVPIAIFEVPVEIEARLSVDDRGQVKVTTSRVQAVGAALPDGVTAELGRRIDDQGTRAIADALPPGAVARRVVVEPERIRVELAS